MMAETRLTLVAAVATLLTSLSLAPLFTGWRWFLLCLGAVVIAASASAVARRLSAPLVLIPPIASAALLCYLTVVFARSGAFFGFIPGPQALASLDEITRQGLDDIQRYAAPVPSLTGITLVTAASIGLVAIAVDVLAVRARKAAAAGLPLLAVFSVTSAIQGEAGWLAFVCAASGYCALLMADARTRLTRWGRGIPAGRRGAAAGSYPESVSTGTLAASGRRIGVGAVAVAVLLPALIPDLPGRETVSGWLSGVGAGGGGTSTIRAPDPFVSLKRELTVPGNETVLRYRSDDQSPDYLRLYALSEFDGRNWSMAPFDDRNTRDLPDTTLARPPGAEQVPASEVSTRVTINDEVEGLRFLPLPYPPRRIDIRGQWRYDRETLMAFSRSDAAGGRSYEVTSWDVQPERQHLAGAAATTEGIPDTFLELPDELPDMVSDLAFEITADADGAYGAAIALQEWFTEPGRFTYSLDAAPGSGSSAIVDFLRERVGYCEQFASTMAVMARVLGIPARVSVGYTSGTQQQDDSWVVTNQDAHAWPELYFSGIGWLRFEPTPAASGQPTASVPPYAQPVQDTSGESTGGDGQEQREDSAPESDDGEASPADGPQRVEERLGGAGATDGGGPGDGGLPWGVLAGFVGLGLLACAPAAARRMVRRHRWARAGSAEGRAHVAWSELRDDVRDLGLPWWPSETPRAVARRLSRECTLGPAETQTLYRITTAAERARYARTPASGKTLRADSHAARKALARSAGWPRRLRRLFLPASTLRIPRQLAIWTADGLNWLDSAASRAATGLTEVLGARGKRARRDRAAP